MRRRRGISRRGSSGEGVVGVCQRAAELMLILVAKQRGYGMVWYGIFDQIVMIIGAR